MQAGSWGRVLYPGGFTSWEGGLEGELPHGMLEFDTKAFENFQKKYVFILSPRISTDSQGESRVSGIESSKIVGIVISYNFNPSNLDHLHPFH